MAPIFVLSFLAEWPLAICPLNINNPSSIIPSISLSLHTSIALKLLPVPLLPTSAMSRIASLSCGHAHIHSCKNVPDVRAGRVCLVSHVFHDLPRHPHPPHRRFHHPLPNLPSFRLRRLDSRSFLLLSSSRPPFFALATLFLPRPRFSLRRSSSSSASKA